MKSLTPIEHTPPSNLSTTELPLSKGSILTLQIDELAFGGKGLARYKKFIIFVNRTIPGQVVKAKVVKKKKNYAEAQVVEIVQDSPDAVTAPCPHFGTCGGCLFQNLDYKRQLEYKRCQVIDTLQHIGGLEQIKVEPTLPSTNKYFYRNKMEYSFSDKRWLTTQEIQSSNSIKNKDFALGLHVPGRYDKVIDLKKCFLLSEISNDILNEIKTWAKESNLLPYSTSDHSGFLRFLVIREGKNTGQIMINIVTSDQPESFSKLEKLQKTLCTSFPSITTIVHNINKKKAQIAVGDEEQILFGPGYIMEKLNRFKFRISANSFFQTNSKQAENLYRNILEWGRFSPDDIVYDLYSGTGSIAVYIAEQVNKVIAFELVPQAIEDAKHNCHLNNIDNCIFISGDLKEQLSQPKSLMARFGKPDKIIIDPPRSGMHPELSAKIVELSPEKIIYVSCNPATLSRDIKLLCEKQYTLKTVRPVDMFPHTAHCEVIAQLVKIS